MKCNKASIVIAQTSNIDSASTGGALELQELFIAGGYTDGTAAQEDRSSFPAKLDLLQLYIRNQTP